MLELNRQPQPAAQRRLITSFAHNEAEILEAQRLRYKVFAEEMGANLSSAKEGIDRDIFDKYCEHLLVRESAENKVVGTYRILSPDQA
jgi:putative hemolysin